MDRTKGTRNIRIDISYDGSNYHGWQRQKGQATIQEAVENAIASMTGESVNLTASGRTDAGVHAICQSANFITRSTIPIEGFKKGLNSLLPEDIAVISAKEAKPGFHARKCAKSKTYRYRIIVSQTRLPLVARRAWIISQPLDLEKMQEASGILVGTHDFSSFMAAGSNVSTTVRTITEIAVRKTFCKEYLPLGYLEYQIEVRGTGFLRYMVRNITSLLKEVGEGNVSTTQVEEVLSAKDRGRVPPTAPAWGLYLVKVEY